MEDKEQAMSLAKDKIISTFKDYALMPELMYKAPNHEHLRLDKTCLIDSTKEMKGVDFKLITKEELLRNCMEVGIDLASKVDQQSLCEVADFTHGVGNTGADMTEVNFLESIYTAESNGFPSPYCMVLHPIQVNDLRVALSTSTGAIWGSPSAPSEDLGAFASLYGVDVFKSRHCISVNVDADRQGVLMPMGMLSPLAYNITDINFTIEEDIEGLIITASLYFKCECIDANRGVAIITDHE